MTGGLNRLKDGKFTAYTTKEGLSNDRVRTIYEDHEGAIWLGTRGAGVTRCPAGRSRTSRPKNGLSGDFVRSVAEDGARPALGRDVGRRPRRDGGRALPRLPREGRTAERDHPVDVPGSRRNALDRHRRGRPRRRARREVHGLRHARRPRRRPRCSRSSRTGTATSGSGPRAAASTASLTESSRPSRPGTASPTTRSSRCTRTPTAVSGSAPTGAASTASRTASSRRFTRREGLFDDVQYAILEDGRGNLWMSCSRGIFRVRRQDLEDLAEASRAAAVPLGLLRPRRRHALGRVQRLHAAGGLEGARRAALVSDDRGRGRHRSRSHQDEHDRRRPSSSSRSLVDRQPPAARVRRSP